MSRDSNILLVVWACCQETRFYSKMTNKPINLENSNHDCFIFLFFFKFPATKGGPIHRRHCSTALLLLPRCHIPNPRSPIQRMGACGVRSGHAVCVCVSRILPSVGASLWGFRWVNNEKSINNIDLFLWRIRHFKENGM